jgi:predicted ATPase
LRALALLTVLTAEPHPSVLAIEELENGIYPGRLRRLLSILRDIVVQDGKPQILLTSHSPVVVAAFRDKPQSLRVVDIVVRDGKRDTRIRPVGKPKTPQDAAFVASFKELDSILHAADAEVAE